jgi:CRP-like cAMP-binding protein
MNQAAERVRLPHLEPIGDATPFAAQIHALIERSPLFENFNLAEIRLMSHFMQVYRADSGMELVREGEAGVFKQDRWNAPRLIAVLDAGQTVGEMSMIDGEPRFASCIASEPCTLAVLTRESLARIILEQPVLGAKILMELVLMLSKRLRQTSAKLVGYMDKYEGKGESGE